MSNLDLERARVRARKHAIGDCLFQVDLANCETYECSKRGNLPSGFNYEICGDSRVVSFLLGVEYDRAAFRLILRVIRGLS